MSAEVGAAWSRSDGSEPLVTLHSGLYNGRLLTAVPYTSGAECSEQCLRQLQECGIQLPMEKCRRSLRIPALIPEVQRYIFFSSRGFGMILALVLYASVWVNLYSTAQVFMGGPSWVTSIPVTLAAVIFTAVIIILLNQHQKKININTDIRLAAANELLMEYNVLLGISDRSQSCQNIPSLCFIYFHLLGCQQRLSQHLASMHQDDIRHCLSQLFIVIETPADPLMARVGTGDHVTEESPLLSSGSREKPVLCSRMIPLILWDKPEVMARQLLVISSACYVRLLTSGQLPKTREAGHTGILDAPCPCQFIKGIILMPGRCFSCI
ncbi:transmembrane protein 268 [Gastrophryne carolinensis]